MASSKCTVAVKYINLFGHFGKTKDLLLITNPEPIDSTVLYINNKNFISPLQSVSVENKTEIVKYYNNENMDYISMDFISNWGLEIKICNQKGDEISVSGIIILELLAE